MIVSKDVMNNVNENVEVIIEGVEFASEMTKTMLV